MYVSMKAMEPFLGLITDRLLQRSLIYAPDNEAEYMNKSFAQEGQKQSYYF